MFSSLSSLFVAGGKMASKSGADISIDTPTPTYTKASENICMWSQNSDACDSPRSCYDCLNSSPGDGVECVISSAGVCTTMDDYVWQQDYRLNTSDVAPHYFPSTNTTYCEGYDPVCLGCQGDFNSSRDTKPSQYCVGVDGCVCVSFCESFQYTAIVPIKYCTTLNSPEATGIAFGDAVTIVNLCFAVPTVGYLLWMWRRRKRRLAREVAYRHRPRAHGPLLPLVGWKEYFADLVAKETATLGAAGGGGGQVSSPTIAATQNGDDETQRREEVSGINASSNTLTNLQVAALSIEFHHPQHPLTNATGRRHSSADNARAGRLEQTSEDEAEPRETPYGQLIERPFLM